MHGGKLSIWWSKALEIEMERIWRDCMGIYDTARNEALQGVIRVVRESN